MGGREWADVDARYTRLRYPPPVDKPATGGFHFWRRWRQRNAIDIMGGWAGVDHTWERGLVDVDGWIDDWGGVGGDAE